MKDEEEKFETERNFIEYSASFTNPESVRKIREAREKEIKIGDDEFKNVLKSNFGRDIKFEKPDDYESSIHTVDLEKTMKDLKDNKFDTE